MKCSRKSNANVNLYDDAFNINSMKLIRLVRGQGVLYDCNTEGYADKNHKEIIWERISKALFPQYDTLEETVQNDLRANVRRRWKTLRDSLSREVKKNPTVENYSRIRDSPIISELEFLIPHIRSSHCAKLADELGLRDCYANVVEAESHDENSSTHIIDLTEDVDIKPFIKPDGFDYNGEDDVENGNESFSSKPLRGQPGLNSTANLEASVDSSINANWSRQYCTIAELKDGEFISVCEEEDKSNSQNDNSKRARIESDNSKEVQEKILQLLTDLGKRERTEHEGEDEDRMFLLSLVSDLRRVPAAEKMHVKMEIVSAIARANY